MFKILDILGQVLPNFGPFVDAFTNMFGDLIVFIVIVILLSAATAVAMSPIFCRYEPAETSPVVHDVSYVKNAVLASDDHTSEKIGYATCYESAFWFFFVKATGGESLESLEILHLADAMHHGEEQFFANLQYFSKPVRAFVVIIISMFEVMTAFCLLKGILLHSGIISKKEARSNTRFKLTRIYVENIYNKYNLPLPWNFIYYVIKLVTCGNYPKLKNRKSLGGLNHVHWVWRGFWGFRSFLLVKIP